MTDTEFENLPDFNFTPKVEEITDEIDKAYTLVVNGLTKEQFEVLSEGVIRSVRTDPRNRTAKFAGKVALLGLTMVFLAACVWAVAQILTPLTNR